MEEETMREAIEELLRGVSAALARARVSRHGRLPRSLRPHGARSTFLHADPRTARRVIV